MAMGIGMWMMRLIMTHDTCLVLIASEDVPTPLQYEAYTLLGEGTMIHFSALLTWATDSVLNFFVEHSTYVLYMNKANMVSAF